MIENVHPFIFVQNGSAQQGPIPKQLKVFFIGIRPQGDKIFAFEKLLLFKSENLNRYFNLHNNYRRVIFYSESKNDWPHLKGVIKEVLKDANIYICYISSDKNDPGLKYNNYKFKKILIDNQHLLSWLFKNIETKIMIMTKL